MAQDQVDYYAQNEMTSGSQDIADFSKHFRRRGALCRFLGITPGYVEKRNILEFGPGSGHNSIYTASLNPAKYVLVDGNPVALREADRLLANYNAGNITFVLSSIEDYADDDEYDLVIGEGFLAVQKFPRQILDKMASFVRPGGILATTTRDSLSFVSDILRATVGKALRRPELPLREQAERLIPVFEPHVKALPGMSRPLIDWILDQVLQPISLYKLFSFGELLEASNDSLVFLGSSPNFVTDWRWYKDCVDDDLVNANAMTSYKRNCHNLLDCRFVYPERNLEDNAALTQMADRLCKSCGVLEGCENATAFDAIREELMRMAENIESFGEGTAKALRDAANGFKNLKKHCEKTDFGTFCEFWGRGQQYVSLVKR